MTSHRFITRTLTTGLVGAALAASSAVAGPPLDPITPQMTPQEQQVIASRGQGAPYPAVHVPVTHVAPKAQSADGSGFDVGDAAIGAGIAGGLLLVVGLGTVAVTHKRPDFAG
jgi:hypothetical protein